MRRPSLHTVMCAFILALICIAIPTVHVNEAKAQERSYPISSLSAVGLTNDVTPAYLYADTSKRITHLKAATKLIITGKSNGYYRIIHNNGVAYVNPKMVSKYYPIEPLMKLGATIAATPVYLIADTSKTIDTLGVNKKVEITGKSNGYYQINYGDTVAFVNPKFIGPYYDSEPLNFNGEISERATVYGYADTSNIIGEIAKGTNVKVVSKSNGYYQIEYNQKTGFIHPRYVLRHYPVEKLSLLVRTISATEVYKTADTAHLIEKLAVDKKLNVIGKSNGYYQIEYGNGVAYIHPKNVTQYYKVDAISFESVLKSDAIVYEFADTSKQLGKLSKLVNVQVKGKSNGYYQIRYNNGYGFVDAKLVREVDKVDALTEAGTTKSAVKVYKYADTFLTIGSLKQYTKITITGKSNGYYRIVYGNTVGFIDAKEVVLDSKVESLNEKGTTKKQTTVYKFAETSVKLGTLLQLKNVTITGKANGYYRIIYGKTVGYVKPSDIILHYPIEKLSLTGIVTLKKDVYSYADTSIKQGTIAKNTVVTVIGKSNGYYRIKYGTKTGYITPKNLVLETTYSAVAKVNVNKLITAYNAPSTSSKKIMTIAKGQEVILTHKIGSWYKIEYKKKSAWILQGQVKELKILKINDVGILSKTTIIKKLPTLASASIGTNNRNINVNVTGKVGNWYRIIYKNQVAYVKSDYLYIDKKVSIGKQMKLMSSAAYKDKPPTKILDGNWEYYEFYSRSNSSLEMYIFRRPNGNKYDYTFAIRGTVLSDPKDLSEDIYTVIGGGTLTSILEAQLYVNSIVKRDIDKIGNVYFTGHSLGGYIAAWLGSSAVDNEIPGLNLINTRTYTFNAPGVLNYTAFNLPSYLLTEEDDKKIKLLVNSKKLNAKRYEGYILNYIIETDHLIGKRGTHLGNVKYFRNPTELWAHKLEIFEKIDL